MVCDSDTYQGALVVLYAEVFDQGPFEGEDVLFAFSGSERPWWHYELEDVTMVWMQEGSAQRFSEGDALRIEGVVYGTSDYETQDGAETVLAIDAVNVRRVDWPGSFSELLGDLEEFPGFFLPALDVPLPGHLLK